MITHNLQKTSPEISQRRDAVTFAIDYFYKDLEQCTGRSFFNLRHNTTVYGGAVSFIMHGTTFSGYELKTHISQPVLEAMFEDARYNKIFEVTVSETAITLINHESDEKFQFITYDGGEGFDLRHCQVGFSLSKQALVYNQSESLQTLLNKQLYLGNDVRNPFHTLSQVQKYLTRGFNLPQKEYAKLMALIMKVNAYDSVNAYGLLVEVAKTGANS